jgi:hypothetical protein
MLFGVSVTSHIPIFISKERIAQASHIAQRQCHTLTPSWIAGCSRISNQGDAV